MTPKLMYSRGMCKIQIFPAGVGTYAYRPTDTLGLSVGQLHLPHTTVSPPAQKHLLTPLQKQS